MLTSQKSFLWLSKVFCLIFSAAIFACHFNRKTHLVVMKNIFSIMRNALLAMKDKILKTISLTLFTMKRCISYRASFKLPYVFTFLLMLSGGFPLFAQHISGHSLFTPQNSQREENLVVAFSSPFSYTLGENVTWELKDENGSLVLSGKGDVSRHVFGKPGNYTLHIHENINHDTSSCEHAHFPEKLNIEVRPAKLDFDFSAIYFRKMSQADSRPMASPLQ